MGGPIRAGPGLVFDGQWRPTVIGGLRDPERVPLSACSCWLSHTDLSSKGTGFPRRPAARYSRSVQTRRDAAPQGDAGWTARKGRCSCFSGTQRTPPQRQQPRFHRSESKWDLYRRVCAFICSVSNSSCFVALQNNPAHKGIPRTIAQRRKRCTKESRYHSEPRRESIIPPRSGPSAGDSCASVRPPPPPRKRSPPRDRPLARGVASSAVTWIAANL